jgi:hypothetical protein
MVCGTFEDLDHARSWTVTGRTLSQPSHLNMCLEDLEDLEDLEGFRRISWLSSHDM